MSFLFGRRPRTNTVDLPKQAKEQISKVDGPVGPAKVQMAASEERRMERLTEKQAEELAKTLAQMKFVLQGTQGVHDSAIYSPTLL